MYISICTQDFDIKEESDMLAPAGGVGALVTFTGKVRAAGEHGELLSMVLEHYPGMTEASIAVIVQEAQRRWELSAVRVIHRVGRLLPGDNIVFVGVASTHRAAAFNAAEFIMDYLKNQAPFWKKEITATGEYWVEQKQQDRQAVGRWQ